MTAIASKVQSKVTRFLRRRHDDFRLLNHTRCLNDSGQKGPCGVDPRVFDAAFLRVPLPLFCRPRRFHRHHHNRYRRPRHFRQRCRSLLRLAYLHFRPSGLSFRVLASLPYPNDGHLCLV